MKKRELKNMGITNRAALAVAAETCSRAAKEGFKKSVLRTTMQSVTAKPEEFLEDKIFGELARTLTSPTGQGYQFKNLDYEYWGDEIDDDAHRQMRNACRLPVSVKGALMADAHVGYGLPIGGVLATKDAVIPYAVGVDIACRVKVTLLDIPLDSLKRLRQPLAKSIEDNTNFGIGGAFKHKKQHAVMDDKRWRSTPYLQNIKDKAWSQLGTSGSGNHFVEFGEFELFEKQHDLDPGRYLALVSHSGSRGPGSMVANHYSKMARAAHPELPSELKHLAWLSMDSDGAEYWEAMELMGDYASANHALIHRDVLKQLGAKPILQVENHHNFAWKEEHDGEEVIVHRKGATPAAEGEQGYIPGTMADPGYLVEGKGAAESLRSSAHGAGRRMSRKKAKNTTTAHAMHKSMREQGIDLMDAGCDESPHAYKNIDEVMNAQSNLVRVLGKFQPRIVKMAPEGEKPED